MKFETRRRLEITADEALDVLTGTELWSNLTDLPSLVVLDSKRTDAPDGHVHLRLDMRFTGDLPAGADRFVRGDLHLRNDIDYDPDAQSATFHIVAPGLNRLLNCSGTYEFSDEDGVTVWRTIGDLRIAIPILGRRFENALVLDLTANLDAIADGINRTVA